MIEDVIDEVILPEIFGDKESLSQSEFREKFDKECAKFLSSMRLRYIVYEKIS